jgi:hypothetical protein
MPISLVALLILLAFIAGYSNRAPHGPHGGPVSAHPFPVGRPRCVNAGAWLRSHGTLGTAGKRDDLTGSHPAVRAHLNDKQPLVVRGKKRSVRHVVFVRWNVDVVLLGTALGGRHNAEVNTGFYFAEQHLQIGAKFGGVLVANVCVLFA